MTRLSLRGILSGHVAVPEPLGKRTGALFATLGITARMKESSPGRVTGGSSEELL